MAGTTGHENEDDPLGSLRDEVLGRKGIPRDAMGALHSATASAPMPQAADLSNAAGIACVDHGFCSVLVQVTKVCAFEKAVDKATPSLSSRCILTIALQISQGKRLFGITGFRPRQVR